MSNIYLFNASATSFSGTGKGALTEVIECNIIEELNGGYELNMSILNSDPLFKSIKVGSIIVTTPNSMEPEQPFLVESVSKAINGVVEIYAEQYAVYRSKLTPLRPTKQTNKKYKNLIPDLLNAFMESSPLTLGVTGKNDWLNNTATLDYPVPHTLREIMGGMQGSVLDIIGGEWSYNGISITLNQKRGRNNGLKVLYGQNMTDYKEEEAFSWSDSITGYYPYWYNDNAETQADKIQLGSIQYSSKANSYPYKKTVPLDLSDQWENKPTVTQLNNKAKTLIGAKGKSVTNIDCTFEAIQQYVGYQDLKDNIDRLALGDTVQVINSEYNTSYTSRIIAYDWNVLLDRYNSVTIGDKKATISEAISDASKSGEDTITISASHVGFSNTSSGSSKGNVQGALDELYDWKNGINITNKYPNEVQVPNNASTTLYEFALSKGVYIVQITVSFQSNGTGLRRIGLSSSSTSFNDNRMQMATCNAVSGYATILHITTVLKPTQDTTYYVKGIHNAGTQLGATVGARYTKLN